ncbi:MAG: hypothetical protein R2729_21665 [Bryobacteraceae bacterium]
MFESLDDTMKHDDKAASSPKERAVVWVAVAILSVLLFGGLYFGVQFLS